MSNKKNINWGYIKAKYIAGVPPRKIVEYPSVKKYNVKPYDISAMARRKNWKKQKTENIQKTTKKTIEKISDKASDKLTELTEAFEPRWKNIIKVAEREFYAKNSDGDPINKINPDLSITDVKRISDVFATAQKNLADLWQIPLLIKMQGDKEKPIEIKLDIEKTIDNLIKKGGLRNN